MNHTVGAVAKVLCINTVSVYKGRYCYHYFTERNVQGSERLSDCPMPHSYQEVSQMALVVRNPSPNRRCKRPGLNPWVRKIPWKKKCQPTPVFLLGDSHGQRSLVGYSPGGGKESDTTELT